MQTREENWGTMSTSLRKWFNGPPPGAPRTKDEGEFEKDPPEKTDPPLDTFAIVQMDVREVDYVDLVHNRRQLYTKNGLEWNEEALNP